MDDDKVLDELEDLKRKGRFRKIRKTYKKHRMMRGFGDYFGNYLFGGNPNLGDDFLRGKKLLKSEEADPVEVGAIAHHLMEGGTREYHEGEHPYDWNWFKHSLLGAQLYEKLGKGKKAIPKLMGALDFALDREKGDPAVYKKQTEDFIRRNLAYEEVERYLKRGPETRQEGGLAGRVGVFALFVVGGVVLSLTSLTITGNAVSNLTRTTPGLLGVILFIAGLTGLFFYFKER